MTAIAPTLQAFFTERLAGQRNASPNTIAAYRDTLRLLLDFAAKRLGDQPCQLDIGDLDAPLIAAFLTHWRPTAATAFAPATPAWPRSTRSTDTHNTTTPSTHKISSACSRSPRSAQIARS
jgi:hypothetical protein